jgi:hypothetical protein
MKAETLREIQLATVAPITPEPVPGNRMLKTCQLALFTFLLPDVVLTLGDSNMAECYGWINQQESSCLT